MNARRRLKKKKELVFINVKSFKNKNTVRLVKM
jgi:hypothetical protein